MALSTEAYNADGSRREFQVASKVLSESHVRVHIDYNDGNGDIAIPSNQWDLLGSTVLFNTNPTSGSTVKITVSTDGEGLDDAPTDISNVASNIDKILTLENNLSEITEVNDNIIDIVTVAENINNINTVSSSNANVNIVATNINSVNTTSTNVGSVNVVASDLSNNLIGTVDYGSVTEAVDNTVGESSIVKVANDIDNVNTVALNIVGLGNIALSLTEILQADTNAQTATTQAGIATDAADTITGMTVATGAVGTFVTWDSVNGILTVPRGDKGDKGDIGLTGPQGETGPQGLKGDTGDTGPTGPQGPIGLTGPEGPQGIQGPAGLDGQVQTIIGGTNITVDSTDVANPIVNFTNTNYINTTDDFTLDLGGL